MREVTNRMEFPWRTVVMMETQFPSGALFRGSGAIVGINDVLTAAHIIYNVREGGYATSIRVFPGADPQPADFPYGEWSDWGLVDARDIAFDPDGDGFWSFMAAENDIALVGFRSRIGEATGWMGTWPWSGDLTGTAVGYPLSATGMMAEDVRAEAAFYSDVFIIPTALGAGASGGPLATVVSGETYVVGVLSAASVNSGDSAYAQLSGDGTWDWFIKAAERNDALLLPPTQSFYGFATNDRLVGTSQDDQLWGYAGADVLTGGAGSDLVVGGDGTDIAVFGGRQSDYAVESAGTNILEVRHYTSGATDSLYNVERLVFQDRGLALDLDGDAGEAAKVLGAVFGPAALNNLSLVGTALQYADRLSELELMDLALTARLGSARSNSSVVSLLFTNVMGYAPYTSEVASYVGLLLVGTYTQAGLGVLAAESGFNALRIDLAGLHEFGLLYI